MNQQDFIAILALSGSVGGSYVDSDGATWQYLPTEDGADQWLCSPHGPADPDRDATWYSQDELEYYRDSVEDASEDEWFPDDVVIGLGLDRDTEGS